MKKFWEGINYLFFPPLCLHCKKIGIKEQIFCPACLEYFALLDPKERCSDCFLQECTCTFTKRYPSLYLFELEGPAKSLYVYCRRPTYSWVELFSAYFLVQWNICKWPKPDRVIPCRWFTYEAFLAKQIALLLGVEYGICPTENREEILFVIDFDGLKKEVADKLFLIRPHLYYCSVFNHYAVREK